jgi:3-keto-disaccharide hydrolase
MKRLNFYALLLLIVGTAAGKMYGQTDNTLTRKEIQEGWKLLFDGRTRAGWMNAKTKQFPSGGWEIRDGMLLINPAAKAEGGGGDIVSTEKYRNFELSVDFRYTPGANSGIKYFVDTERDNGQYSSIGCEYQILDDKRHPDAREGINGNRTLAGLYDLIAPKHGMDNGPDKWNTATIIVRGNHVQHLLNGELTVDYERGNQAWKELVAGSKFKSIPGFGENAEGRILLQDHGDAVAFKNIKIREIK